MQSNVSNPLAQIFTCRNTISLFNALPENPLFRISVLQTRFKKANCTVLHFRIADSVEADLFVSFERMCGFIGKSVKSFFID